MDVLAGLPEWLVWCAAGASGTLALALAGLGAWAYVTRRAPVQVAPTVGATNGVTLQGAW